MVVEVVGVVGVAGGVAVGVVPFFYFFARPWMAGAGTGRASGVMRCTRQRLRLMRLMRLGRLDKMGRRCVCGRW